MNKSIGFTLNLVLAKLVGFNGYYSQGIPHVE